MWQNFGDFAKSSFPDLARSQGTIQTNASGDCLGSPPAYYHGAYFFVRILTHRDEIVNAVTSPFRWFRQGENSRATSTCLWALDDVSFDVREGEVLAVGDVSFQKKCLGKMSDVARGGRTVLFVSHNMAAVRKLCSRGVLLEGGKLTYNGPADTAVESYLDEGEFGEENGPVHIRKNLSGAHQAGFAIESIALLSKNGEVPRDLKTGDSILLRIQYVAERRFMGAEFIVSCKSEWGEEIFRTTTSYGTPAIH